jgi:hypothetical protein
MEETTKSEVITTVKVRFQSVTFLINKAGIRHRAQIRMPRNAIAIVGADAAQMLTDIDLLADIRFFGTGAAGLLAIPAGSIRQYMDESGSAFLVNALAGQKTYYAQPKRLGIPRFEFGGVVGGFLPPVTISVTDIDTGITEDYYLFESLNAGLGLTEVFVNQP